MTDTYIDEDALILETHIPEGRAVDGLHYGAHVSRSSQGWSGYYVRLPDGERWGVARLSPCSEDLPETDDDETQDQAIVRCIAAELDA